MQVEAASHDSLLQASRRLDWRFLLPRPDLGRVACIDAADPELVESLRLFSDEFTAGPSDLDAPMSGEAADLDLVVLRNPSLDTIESGGARLTPGGWLYIEVESPLRRMRASAPRSARGYAHALRKLGFVEVDAHMHWPDFASCRAIVPLDDAVAVRHALARGQRGSRARVVGRLAPMLAATRQLALFAPCASVLGRRASSVEGGAR